MMKKAITFLGVTFAALLMALNPLVAQKKAIKPNKKLLKTIETNFKDAADQYKFMMGKLENDRFPKTYFPETDKFETSNSGWWCSGFYPGSLLYLYEQTKDEQLNSEARRIMKVLEKEQFNKGTHDLGFMMFCSFGNANRLSPSQEYKEILINSAKSLSSRFNPTVGCIKSWNSNNPDDFLVIIDNMMNLELLFWASKATGDRSFYNIAVQHADNTIKNHFRPDNSSYHVINYNPANGSVKQKRTAQGFSDDSAWARGQAWGLYGYVLMYRETKDQKYLDQANRIASFLLNHPNLPADKIPYWDFNAPKIPDEPRDASAGAIMASALLELQGYVDAGKAHEYVKVAETILKKFSSDEYKAEKGTNGGFILKHSVGHRPNNSEVDVPLTYADYYFIEAMIRYKGLSK